MDFKKYSFSGTNKRINGTWHTAIDNVLSLYDENGNFTRDNSVLLQDIKNELNDKNPVGKASTRKIVDMSKPSSGN